MASKKLTQLPTATEVTTSDKIYIVDVSDTTESPQGTSKQAAVEKILPTITSTDGSIAIDNTDPSAPDLSAVKITSTDGTDIAEFVSEIESGEGRLKAVFNNANFENPFTVLNSDGIIRMGFFNKGGVGAVAPQAAAIADATDATDVITQFNTLLAAMRAYGFIAE